MKEKLNSINFKSLKRNNLAKNVYLHLKKNIKMKIIYGLIILAIINSTIKAQFTSINEAARVAKFNKLIDEVNNGKQKIKYSDINGIPYYSAGFVRAKVGDTPSYVPIRYNTFLDAIEIMADSNVYEIPREESYPKFTFEGTNEKLVLVNSRDEFAGYFFELASGKNRLLKKITTKFYDAVPAPNSLISGTPARFETLKPVYFIKTEDALIKIPKNTKDLAQSFPDKKNELNDFLKSNKTKLNNEADLIKLSQFLNK